MTISVDTHARGLAIYITGETNRAAIGRRLRLEIPRQAILSYPGQFIVPLWSAHVVAREFVEDNVVWSQRAWQYVEDQRRTLARMDAAKLEVAEALAFPRETLGNYTLIDQLDEHQVEAVAAMAVPSLIGLALFDEQGLGKTIMALCAFDRLRETR